MTERVRTFTCRDVLAETTRHKLPAALQLFFWIAVQAISMASLYGGIVFAGNVGPLEGLSIGFYAMELPLIVDAPIVTAIVRMTVAGQPDVRIYRHLKFGRDEFLFAIVLAFIFLLLPFSLLLFATLFGLLHFEKSAFISPVICSVCASPVLVALTAIFARVPDPFAFTGLVFHANWRAVCLAVFFVSIPIYASLVFWPGILLGIPMTLAIVLGTNLYVSILRLALYDQSERRYVDPT